MSSDNVVPRSTSQIIADLLQATIDSQWSDRANTSCHCHPEYTPCCPECGEHEYTHEKTYNGWGVMNGYVQNKHKTDCKHMALIREARAYLRIENNLAEERGEEGVYVP